MLPWFGKTGGNPSSITDSYPRFHCCTQSHHSDNFYALCYYELLLSQISLCHLPWDAHIHLSQNIFKRCPKSLSHFLPIKNPILWINTPILTIRLSDCLTWTPQQPDSHTENYFVCIRWSICLSRTPLHVSKNLTPNILPSPITGLQSKSQLMFFKHRCKENHVGHNLSYQSFGKIAQDKQYCFLGYIQNVETANLECLSVREPRGRTLLVSLRTPGSLVMFWVLMKTAQRTTRQVSPIKQDEAAAPQANCKWQTSHGATLQVAHWNKGTADQAPAAPGFSAPRKRVGFQTRLETTHENFSSLTTTFGPWRSLE